MKRRATPSDALSPLERWPAHITRQMMERCATTDNASNARLIAAVACLSHRMAQVIRDAYRHGQCARIDCARIIRPYEEYYALGGGAVVTCRRCACDLEFTVKVGRATVTHRRGWDRAAKAVWWTKLQRVMI